MDTGWLLSTSFGVPNWLIAAGGIGLVLFIRARRARTAPQPPGGREPATVLEFKSYRTVSNGYRRRAA